MCKGSLHTMQNMVRESAMGLASYAVKLLRRIYSLLPQDRKLVGKVQCNRNRYK